MKFIRALNNSQGMSLSFKRINGTKQWHLAQARRNEKVPHSKGRAVIYTRDVAATTNNLISGVKRRAVKKAQHRLNTLIQQGARPRSIRRAEDKLALRQQTEQDQKARKEKI